MPTAQRAKVGIPTGEMSEAGKPLYKTAEGETVSEKSITVPFGDKWVNVPSIQDGVRYEDDEIEDMLAAGEIKPTSTHSTMEEAVSAAQERSSGLIKPKMAKGGQVKSQTKRLLAEGGLKHQGGTKDPVSGNNVPVGATQEEVRDDIPAQLSEGEFVFPADVVRFIGLERLMMMRQAAKHGLMKMEEMGQMSNGDEGTEEEDTSEFESSIDEIMGVMDEVDGKRKMAEGGMPMSAPAAPAPAMEPAPQTAQAIPTAAPAPEANPEVALPTQVESTPTEGLKSVDIIRNNLKNGGTPEQTDAFLKQVALLEKAGKAISIRHNDTVVIGFVKQPGVLDPMVFSENQPKEFDQAISVAMDTFKKSGVKRLESSNPDKMTIEYLTAKGYPIEQGTPESGFTWALNL